MSRVRDELASIARLREAERESGAPPVRSHLRSAALLNSVRNQPRLLELLAPPAAVEERTLSLAELTALVEKYDGKDPLRAAIARGDAAMKGWVPR